MTEEERPHAPSTNQPLNAKPRPRVTPVLAVIGLVVVIAVIFLLLTWFRFNGD